MAESTPSEHPPFTLFVNTVDHYDDCWMPFFDLLDTYWPNCRQPVVLNTERRSFQHPRIDIRPVMGSVGVPGGTELPWGRRLLNGLATVDTEYVLYIAEDCFLMDPVREDEVNRLLRLMDEHRLHCIRLVEPEGAGPYRASPHDGVWEVDPSARYLAMLQAGLWRTSTLSSLVDPHDNPWRFERVGGSKIREAGYAIHCIDRDRYWTDPATRILPYDPVTGILAGRWRVDVIGDLFAAHGIEVDYDERGWEDGEHHRGPVRRFRDRVRGWLRSRL